MLAIRVGGISTTDNTVKILSHQELGALGKKTRMRGQRIDVAHDVVDGVSVRAAFSIAQ
jgi:hypothetical protein